MAVSVPLLLALGALLARAQAPPPTATASPGIISVQGGTFVDANCKAYAFAGANVWGLLEDEAGVAGSPSTVANLFSQAQAQGINLVRFFPNGVTDAIQLQTAPGVYNEQAWAALDSLIAQANQAGVKLILPFIGNWNYIEGKQQYVDWAGLSTPDEFYTSNVTRQYYMNHVQAMTGRVNSVNGNKYSNEPAIFAWDLMNEPRAACDVHHPNASCDPSAADSIQSWINDMATFVKQQDPNHLLTVGEEGFFGFSQPASAATYNPNADSTNYAIKAGQDFKPNHESPSIDFVAVHIWPDNWEANSSFCDGFANPTCGVQFVENFLSSHVAVATALGKPLIIEEFGKGNLAGVPQSEPERIQDFSAIYNALSTSLAANGPIKGAAFWEWAFWENGDSSASNGNTPGDFVSPSDSSWATVQNATQNVQSFLANQKGGLAKCIPGTLRASSLLSPPQGTGATTGRKLSAADNAREALRTYATAGANLEQVAGEQPLAFLAAGHVHDCAAACEGMREGACQAFSYASALQDGSKNCKLWASTTADTLQWSVTGYQTFWSHAV